MSSHVDIIKCWEDPARCQPSHFNMIIIYKVPRCGPAPFYRHRGRGHAAFDQEVGTKFIRREENRFISFPARASGGGEGRGPGVGRPAGVEGSRLIRSHQARASVVAVEERFFPERMTDRPTDGVVSARRENVTKPPDVTSPLN